MLVCAIAILLVAVLAPVQAYLVYKTVYELNDRSIYVDEDLFSVTYVLQNDFVVKKRVMSNDEIKSCNPNTCPTYLSRAPSNAETASFSNGFLYYTPLQNFCGYDSAEYCLSGTDDVCAEIKINVRCVNDAPVARNILETIFENTSASILLRDLINAAYDVEGDTIKLRDFDTRSVQGGSIERVENSGNPYLRYTPPLNFVGQDRFSYAISDTRGYTSIDSWAKIYVNVLSVNVPPVALRNLRLYAKEDSSIEVDGGFLTSVVEDPDGVGRLTVQAVTQPSNGNALILGRFAAIRYTPAPNFCGDDSFTYTVADIAGATVEVTALVRVECVNDSPDAVIDYLSVTPGASVDIVPIDNDFDVDEDPLTTVQLDLTGLDGNATLDNGIVTYTPAEDADCGDSEVFQYTVSDGQGGTAIGTIQVTVSCPTPPPVPPVANGDPHFRRFHHKKRSSFHGECDLVLLKSARSGVAVHIRTTIIDFYSYIERVAMKVSHDTILEFGEDSVYLDGKSLPESAVPIISEADDATRVSSGEDVRIYKNSGKASHYEVHLANGLVVIIKAAGKFMSASLGGDLSTLTDAVGMFGQYGTGALYGRHGQEMKSFEEHAFEWQTHPDLDGILFMESRQPQLPYERCRMPSQSVSSSRRLRGKVNEELLQQATEACSLAAPDDVELCIEDVLLTGSIEVVGSW